MAADDTALSAAIEDDFDSTPSPSASQPCRPRPAAWRPRRQDLRRRREAQQVRLVVTGRLEGEAVGMHRPRLRLDPHSRSTLEKAPPESIRNAAVFAGAELPYPPRQPMVFRPRIRAVRISAGASLMPSPVTATISPRCCSKRTPGACPPVSPARSRCGRQVPPRAPRRRATRARRRRQAPVRRQGRRARRWRGGVVNSRGLVFVDESAEEVGAA